MRSASRNEAGALIDQIAESAIQPREAPKRATSAIRSRPGTDGRSRIRGTVGGPRNASATQPHDCEKYAPWLAFAAITMAAVATPTTYVRCERVIPRRPGAPSVATSLMCGRVMAHRLGTVLLV